MKTVYQNPWFGVVQDGRYHYVKENGADNGAVVLARRDGHFVFVEVDRPAQGTALIEAPRGYGEPGESAARCAARELREETGLQVEASRLLKLGRIQPNSAILASSVTVFFAEVPAEAPVSEPDGEVRRVITVHQDNIKDALATGRITDGFTLSALALYWSSATPL